MYKSNCINHFPFHLYYRSYLPSMPITITVFFWWPKAAMHWEPSGKWNWANDRCEVKYLGKSTARAKLNLLDAETAPKNTKDKHTSFSSKRKLSCTRPSQARIPWSKPLSKVSGHLSVHFSARKQQLEGKK